MLGLVLALKTNSFHSFFEVPNFYRFWSVLERFGEGLGRVWEGFGDEILKPLAKRGTAGGLRSALSAAPPGTSVLNSTEQGLSSIAASKVFA